MKKKLLLVLPRKPKTLFNFPEMPPLGLLTLATLTNKDHFNVSIVNENIERIDLSRKPDIVGISLCTENSQRGYQIADYYSKQGIPVIVGGMHPSALPSEALRHCTSVVIGESEEIWNNVLNDFLNGKLKAIYRQKKQTNLSRLPPVDFSFLNRSYILSNLLQTTRGCPHKCDFCSATNFYGGKIRHKPIDQVLREIEGIKRNHKGLLRNWFFITDDNIIADKNYTRRLFSAVTRANIRIVAQSTASIGKDDELLELAYRAGVRLLYIGFESLDEGFLRKIKKANNPKEYEALIRNIKKHGIGIIGSFIFNKAHLESDTWKKTLQLCEDKLELAFFQTLTMYPGSPLYRRNKKMLEQTQPSETLGPGILSSTKPFNANPKIYGCYKKFYSPKSILKRITNSMNTLSPSPKSLLLLLLLNIHICLHINNALPTKKSEPF